MNRMYLKDEIVVRSLAKFTDSLKNNRIKISDSENKKFLEVTVDATHCGYFNHNLYFYSHDGMAKAVSSWLHPYNKPVLSHHDENQTAIGRIVQAAFIPLMRSHFPNDGGKDEKNINVLRGSPSGKIRLKILITDKEAIDNILDQRFFTVSTGGSPVDAPLCSVCNKPISYNSFGASLSCDHQIGKVYDGKLCGMLISEMDYKEVSFINCPADYSNDHVASVVSMQFVDDSVAGAIELDNVGDNVMSEIKDNIDNKEGVDMEVKTEPIPKSVSEPISDEDFEKLIVDALKELDECETCGDEVDDVWKNEDDKKEAEELAKDYESFVSLSIGYGPEDKDYDDTVEDKKLPPAGSKARAKMKTTFCGPNKTFPVPDCKHVAVALAMLKWPKVVAKYSSSVRAKIAACVRKKAKALNCSTSKKKDEVENNVSVNEKVNTSVNESAKKTNPSDAIDDVKTLNEKIVALEKKIKEDAVMTDGSKVELEKANTKINDLMKELRTKQAEKIIDLSIILKRSNISEIIDADSIEIRDAKYSEKVTELETRSSESLIDSINDLKKDLNILGVTTPIENPVVNDFERVMRDKANKQEDRKSWIKRVFLGE